MALEDDSDINILVQSQWLILVIQSGFLGSTKLTFVFMSSVLVDNDLVLNSDCIKHLWVISVMLTSRSPCCLTTRVTGNYNQLWRWPVGWLYRTPPMTKDHSCSDAGTASSRCCFIRTEKHLGGFIIPGLDSLRASLGTGHETALWWRNLPFSQLVNEYQQVCWRQSAILGNFSPMTGLFLLVDTVHWM